MQLVSLGFRIWSESEAQRADSEKAFRRLAL